MSLEEVKKLLDEFNLGIVSIGILEIACVNSSNFEHEQLGYRIADDGEDLTGSSEGRWRPSWYVIATENADPYFIDLDSNRIYYAMHGEGSWTPNLIAENYAQFGAIVNHLKKLALERKNPVELENKPITKSEQDLFRTFIEEELNLDFGNWELWVEIEDAGHIDSQLTEQKRSKGFLSRIFKR